MLILALLLISALPVHAGQPGQYLEGEIVFSDISHMNVSLNLSLEYAIIDGRNLSADEMRALLESGNENISAALHGMAESVFDSVMQSFHARGNLSTVIVPGQSGPVVLMMEGTASLSGSSCSSEIYRLLGESGAEFQFTMQPLNVPSGIRIEPPGNYTVNGEKSYLWDGKEQQISVEGPQSGTGNTINVFIDIYNIDTTGADQKVDINIFLKSHLLEIPYDGDLPLNVSMKTDYVSVELMHRLISCSYLTYEEWNRSLDTVLGDAQEMLISEFPDIDFSLSEWEDRGDEVVFTVNSTASMPVSQVLYSGAFLRKMISQSMNINLYGTEGFHTTYEVLMPAGMLVNSVHISPSCPSYRITQGDRYGFHAEIDDGSVHKATISIGILIDMDPFVPLIMAVVVLTGMWFIVMNSIPSRRRKR